MRPSRPAQVGLVDWRRSRSNRFIMFAVSKPDEE